MERITHAPGRALLALTCWSLGTVTQAQTPSAPAAAASAAQTLEPVQVRGRRESNDYQAPASTAGALGELRAVDTPFSTVTLTRRLIENQQAASYNDYLKNDPSISFGNVPVGFASLRGFSLGADGYLFDGMPGAAISDGRYQLHGVERIDILKGPAAFLYGLGTSSSLGGTLNFIPKKPGDVPVREAEVSVFSRSLLGAAVDLGDRFGVDRAFGVRLNLARRDGEQAARDADWKHNAATLALDWRVAPGVLVSGGYEYAHNRFPRLQPFYVLFPGVPVPRAPDGSDNVAQPWDDFKVISSTAYARADWKLADDWSLKVQGLRGKSARPNVKEARFGFILDDAGNAALGAQQEESRSTTTTAQASLNGAFSTGPIRHNVTLAGTHVRDRVEGGFAPLTPATIPTNIYAPVDAAEPPDESVPVNLQQKSRSTSVLFSDRIQLTDRWSVLAGVRHARFTVDNYATSGAIVDSPSLTKTQPIGAILWKPLDNASVYVNYGEGLEQGGEVAPGSFRRLPPIVTKQSEIGAKLDLGELTLTAALFDLRRPLETFDQTVGENVQRGTQRHRGFELQAQGYVTPDLSVVAGLAFLKATVSGAGDPTTDGKRPAGVPARNANLFADYRIAGVPGLYVNGGVYFSGRQYLDLANTQEVSSWTRVDLGVRYETRFGGVRTAILAGVENVGGRDYWNGAQGGLLTLAEPRTFKLTARFAL